MVMRIYIWEGNGISSAYPDDGTLIVLAESPEQARQLVRDAEDAREESMMVGPYIDPRFDGSDEALNREPDRVVELDKPAWVAFNGGGYD